MASAIPIEVGRVERSAMPRRRYGRRRGFRRGFGPLGPVESVFVLGGTALGAGLIGAGIANAINNEK